MSDQINKILTVNELHKMIPAAWKNCPIMISTSIGTIKKIRRVSFHDHVDGRRVILIHEDEVKST